MHVYACVCVRACCSYCYLWKWMEVGGLIRTVGECHHKQYKGSLFHTWQNMKLWRGRVENGEALSSLF